MVGFDNGSENVKILDGRVVNTINADLSSASDITTVKVLAENHGLSFKGCEPGGPFDIDPVAAQQFLRAPLNSNNRPNSDVVRPVMNAADLMGVSRRIYTVDFDSMSETEAACYQLPFEYVKRVVYPTRIQNREESSREVLVAVCALSAGDAESNSGPT